MNSINNLIMNVSQNEGTPNSFSKEHVDFTTPQKPKMDTQNDGQDGLVLGLIYRSGIMLSTLWGILKIPMKWDSHHPTL